MHIYMYTYVEPLGDAGEPGISLSKAAQGLTGLVAGQAGALGTAVASIERASRNTVPVL